MNQNVITIDQLLANIRKEREANRKAFKNDIQTLINEEKIDYIEALRAMQESRLFDIYSFILDPTNEEEICKIFEMYNASCEYRYETVYFTDITDWIGWNEKDLNDAGIIDPYKVVYNYAIKTNYIGYIFDW